jgi:hypothetical protein
MVILLFIDFTVPEKGADGAVRKGQETSTPPAPTTSPVFRRLILPADKS